MLLWRCWRGGVSAWWAGADGGRGVAVGDALRNEGTDYESFVVVSLLASPQIEEMGLRLYWNEGLKNVQGIAI